MTNDDNTKRKAALWMLARGMATQSEAAELAGTSRQLVRHWLKTAGIDAPKARADRLKAMWKRRIGR